MTPDQIELMMKIAKKADEVQKNLDEHILKCQSPVEVQSLARPGIEHKLEHINKLLQFNMDVQFYGVSELDHDKRKKISEEFLFAMEDLLSKFGVSKLTGQYVRQNIK